MARTSYARPVSARSPSSRRRTVFAAACPLPPWVKPGRRANASAVCAGRPRFDRARAALRYDAAALPLILPFKHGDRTELAAVLAGMMARAGRTLLADADAILPVPLHRKRLIARRYNQASLLAGGLARLAARPWLPDVLIRHRATTPLGELSAKARMLEVSDAFAVRPARRSAIQGKRLLLIDDVMTSGATASACAAAAIAAGAEHRRCARRGARPCPAERLAGSLEPSVTILPPLVAASGSSDPALSYRSRTMARDRDLHAALLPLLRARPQAAGIEGRIFPGNRRARWQPGPRRGPRAVRQNLGAADFHRREPYRRLLTISWRWTGPEGSIRCSGFRPPKAASNP